MCFICFSTVVWYNVISAEKNKRRQGRHLFFCKLINEDPVCVSRQMSASARGPESTQKEEQAPSAHGTEFIQKRERTPVCLCTILSSIQMQAQAEDGRYGEPSPVIWTGTILNTKRFWQTGPVKPEKRPGNWPRKQESLASLLLLAETAPWMKF